MYRSHAHEMVDHMLGILGDVPREWHNKQELRMAPHFQPLRDRLVERLVHDLEFGSNPFFLRWRDEYEQVLRRQNDQLNRIEGLLSESRKGCRLEEGGDGEGWFGELVSMSLKKGGNKYHASAAETIPQGVPGDEKIFTEYLKEHVENAGVIVIVDPYALNDKNDSGQASSPRKIIKEIVTAAKGSNQYKVHLHLYCHKDNVKVKEWEGLEDDLKDHTLSVYLADFHDRYILTGRNKLIAGRNINASWHDKEFWGGRAFGASLNGVGKRPTYVLDFAPSDIPTLVSYIRTVAPKSVSLDEFKKSQSIGKNAANPNSKG